MWFWEKLFGKKVAGGAGAVLHESLFPDSGAFIELPQHDFYGQCARSPNGRYTIAWQDGGPDQSRKGRWFLLEDGNVLAKGIMPRPNDGKVSDTGVFILNDWGSIETLSGNFKAWRPDGSLILTRKLKANLFNNGLSPDGRFAVCQMCNADSEDSSKLFIFDLSAGAELASWIPESGWAKSYRFEPDGQSILLGYDDEHYFRYTTQGVFLDRSRWLSAGLLKGELHIVSLLLQETKGAPTPELVHLLLPAIEKGIATIHASQGKSRAWALRLRGECYEAIAESAKALGAYTEALSLDPKVGVKRRAEQLRKIVPA